MNRIIARFAVAASLLIGASSAAAAQDSGVSYRQTRYGVRQYQIVRVDLDRADVRMYWKDDRGQPFGSLAALDRWLSARGERMLAATNAGIFYRTREPAGLHIERGQTLRPLNRESNPPPGEAEGNFFAIPNGVFYIEADGTAHIRETQGAAQALGAMREATQSGPLLLSRGVPHRMYGNARVVRNAVAVCGPKRIALVLAPEGASFREMALFIRDDLQCRDALYLDGTISGLRVPGSRVDRDGEYVGIIGVTAKRPNSHP